MQATVQLSLDLTSIADAIATAEMAVRAGVDWLEAGTPLILSEGAHAVRELRARFPMIPIVADLKIMDGAYLETELMAKAGANMVVVMGQAHEQSIELTVKAGHDFGVKVMGDDMAMGDPVAAAKRLQDLGCDYIVHHIGYDLRTVLQRRGQQYPSPLDRLRDIVNAVRIPVQAVGGLTIDQAIETPRYGAPMVVIGAPLAIDANAFQAATGDVESSLRLICDKVHAYGDIRI
ncbi:MAG TPA: orotidine 5'-phosphate decarboxylase / HUMPS family protein [Bryobacteraceae bacterium]|jgi:3-hexulose-6-phosphate synthase/6-phospho-3-hexuloisomerase|nr:orotidine 5'-phosphate decarboxylase / HUMPS family protein [Bryobacteraceae bacterium]